MKTFSFIILSCLIFSACSNIDVFEKNVQIPSQRWFYTNKPSFNFTITDTAALYNIFIVLRHTDAYKYNNIWLRVGIKPPGDTIRFKTIDITLGTDAKGWEGRGMDDIFEVRKNITAGPIRFKKYGNYFFTINQVMRENPLNHILNIGVRVEKIRV